MTRKHPRCNSDLADSLDEARNFVRAFDQMVTDAKGDSDRCRQRLQKDEEGHPVDPAYWKHVGKAMAEFPSLELLPDVLEGICDEGAASRLRSFSPDGDFDLNGVDMYDGHRAARKDFSLCRVTFPFSMTKDNVDREVERLEGGWEPASLLDLGAFLAVSQITLPEGQHLFAPATCLRGHNLYTPCLKDGKLGRFPSGMDAWDADMVLVWRESGQQ